MTVPAEDDVKPILRDFEQRIRQVVDAAWKEWLDFPDRGRFVFIPRVRAVLVFDFIARRALEEFDGDLHIRVLKKAQTVQFLFRKQVLLRFKKANSRGVGSNIVTQEVLRFIDPQGTIPGLVPEIMKIEICYSPDTIGLALDGVEVVARDVNRRIWAYPIERGAAGAEVISIPPRAPDATPPVVVPRKPAAEKKSDEK